MKPANLGKLPLTGNGPLATMEASITEIPADRMEQVCTAQLGCFDRDDFQGTEIRKFYGFEAFYLGRPNRTSSSIRTAEGGGAQNHQFGYSWIMPEEQASGWPEPASCRFWPRWKQATEQDEPRKRERGANPQPLRF